MIDEEWLRLIQIVCLVILIFLLVVSCYLWIVQPDPLPEGIEWLNWDHMGGFNDGRMALEIA